ncbi:MAG: ammonium transporter [Novosphingobium sp. SCN 63-17]|uniref:ammonium transporter n=1 Tax=unclassified Novosphingobium TaxID=2644732 RepID=UPI00086A8142|nr:MULTISPECIES: ammonium transporter [unclassified Novosphingobium]MBN9144127.1 ammonium transporter [Novosphingobium sp.]ODU78662.1 MAG: ammonium transporter [Novosphingobium sp. SCN 63-17]OJX95047.1 MAG: ammonium transporter [Novosphingobium sp. 63-713]
MAAALLCPTPALAQTATGANAADTVWILISSALVLLMCLPGLSLFYGGLVRAKNFLSVMVQVGVITAVASLVWVLVGYALAFGPVSNGWIGGLSGLGLAHLAPVRSGTTLPENTFALFQLCFAAITPALMAGAWVDRARFGWVVAFCGLWGLLVYAPVAHWIWGGGWMSTGYGTLDFAGGIVVHTTAGVSALVAAWVLGARTGFPKTLMLPHSPALTMLGAGLLWVGWFGFNGGSALTGSAAAASAILNTHTAACAAALMWIVFEAAHVGKPTSVGFATGAVAGLATVTPAAGMIAPGAAAVFGLAGACVCYAMIQLVKQRWKIDDSLDVFAVHGVGGMIGSLGLAVAMSPALGGTGYAAGGSMGHQFIAQAVGVGVTAAWSAVMSYVLAVGLGKIMPMRATEDDEREGLDITSHGERAWELD